MAEAIIMPKTGMAMEEGVIIEWLKKEGDHIDKGEPVAEIETDKSTMELESDCEGILLRILYDAGSTVPVTIPIAWVGKAGEPIPSADPVDSGSSESAGSDKHDVSDSDGQEFQSVDDTTTAADMRIRATPAARRAAAEKGIDLSQVHPSGRNGEIREHDVFETSSVRVTPLAARIAEDRGMNLKDIVGSGHDGKIFSTDLPSERAGSSEGTGDLRVPLTTIQKITGSRMSESVRTIPMVTEHIKADVTRMLALRSELNEMIDGSITINDFVLFAAARALRDNPRMNAVLDGDSLVLKGSVHLGMAVAAPKGLVVPVIHDADRYTLSGLSKRARELADAGRSGRLRPDDLQGATFTVSNIGMYGITSFTPIINPPEAGILGVCTIERVPRFVDGEIMERKEMGLSLTFDHRIVDGAEASVFLRRVKEYLEAPLVMLV